MGQDKNAVAQAKLLFHVQNPNYEDIWLEGYYDCQNGIDEMANPYPEGSKEFQFWEDGCWAAMYDEQPLFDYAGNIMPERITTIAESAKIVRAAEYRAKHTISANQSSFNKSRLRTIGQLVIAMLLGGAMVYASLELLE